MNPILSRAILQRVTWLFHSCNFNLSYSSFQHTWRRVNLRRDAISVALPDDGTNYRVTRSVSKYCDDQSARADWISLKSSGEKRRTRKLQQQRKSHAARAIMDRVCATKLHDCRESKLIINLIIAIYATARQVKPHVLKLQTNEKRTTITFQHLLLLCIWITMLWINEKPSSRWLLRLETNWKKSLRILFFLVLVTINEERKMTLQHNFTTYPLG